MLQREGVSVVHVQLRECLADWIQLSWNRMVVLLEFSFRCLVSLCLFGVLFLFYFFEQGKTIHSTAIKAKYFISKYRIEPKLPKSTT